MNKINDLKNDNSYQLIPGLKSIKHTYDIDLSKVDKRIIEANTIVWDEIIRCYCDEKSINPESILPNVHLVVNSGNQCYMGALAFYISSIEKWEIHRFLDFQKHNFKGHYQYTEAQFINMIEYYITKTIPIMPPDKRETILEKISSWHRSQPESKYFETIEGEDTAHVEKWSNKERLLETKKQISDVLKIFSGYNQFDEKIMSAEDYKRLENYTLYMIENKEVPPHARPISRIKLSNQFIIYTNYLIHQSAFGKKRQHFVFVFLKKVFGQFKDISFDEENISKSYIYKNFSTKPERYESIKKKFKP